MSKNDSIILDGSTLICLISKEVEFKIVANIISKAIINSISIAEVARFLIERKNMSLTDAQKLILSSIERIISDAQLAFNSAEIIPMTKIWSIFGRCILLCFRYTNELSDLYC